MLLPLIEVLMLKADIGDHIQQKNTDQEYKIKKVLGYSYSIGYPYSNHFLTQLYAFATTTEKNLNMFAPSVTADNSCNKRATLLLLFYMESKHRFVVSVFLILKWSSPLQQRILYYSCFYQLFLKSER